MVRVVCLLMVAACNLSDATGDAAIADAAIVADAARIADAATSDTRVIDARVIDARIIDAKAIDAAAIIDARPPVDAPPVGACPDPGGMPASTLAAWQRANSSRTAMGVACAALVPALVTSSRKHCEYYQANTGACVSNPHAEVAGCTGFVAEGFAAREMKAGYSGSPAFETMAFGALGASAAQLWIDSVWHRTPVLSPWVRDLGHGEAGSCATMDFGVGAASASTVVAMWPYDGQTGVPTSFNGASEGPEPPVPPDGWPSGYPITIYLRGTVSEHHLTVDGEAVEIDHQFLTPGSDGNTGLLRYEHVLYADAQLRAATRYRVRIVADTATREWTFTTR